MKIMVFRRLVVSSSLIITTCCLIQVSLSFMLIPAQTIFSRRWASVLTRAPSQGRPLKHHGDDDLLTKTSRIMVIAEEQDHERHSRTTTTTTTLSSSSSEKSRRQVLGEFQTRTLGALVLGLSINSPLPEPVDAAMENSQTVFEVGKDLTLEQAKQRFKQGQQSLDELLKNYDDICDKGGGDGVRRYLGTVGTTSGLYGISKVMKIMQNEAEDIVEYTETMNEVNAALQGADGSAYMAIFTVTSTSGVPPEKYFGDAKIEVKRAIKSMKDIATQLDIR